MARGQGVALTRMDVARLGASAARDGTTLAMGVLVPLALLRARAADMRANGTKVAMVRRPARQNAQRGFTDGSAVQIQQRTGFQRAIAGADAGIGAVLRGQQGFGAGADTGVEVVRSGGGIGHGGLQSGQR